MKHLKHLKHFKNSIFILSIISLFTFSGCLEGSNEENIQEIETKANYSISIPETWEIFPKQEYPKYMIFAAREPNYISEIPLSITISNINSLPPSLDILIKKNYEMVRKASQDFKIISEENFTTEEIIKSEISDTITSKKPASRLVIYTEKYAGTNTFAQVYSLNVISYSEKKTYVINILSDMNASEAEKELIMNILQSFTLTR